MAELEYIITIKHTERGAGFGARTALQNFRNLEHSGIIDANFVDKSSNTETKLIVKYDDRRTIAELKEAIENSGRLPSTKSTSGKRLLCEVTSIVLSKEEDRLRNNLERSEKRISELEEEVQSIESKLENATANTVNNPVTGLLSYFSTLEYKPSLVLTDRLDRDYAKKVLEGTLENNFTNYINSRLNQNYSNEEIIDLENYDPKDDEIKIENLKNDAETASQELLFLKQLQNGEIKIPKSLLEHNIELIKSKNHEESLEIYNTAKNVNHEKTNMSRIISGHRRKYNGFAEELDILSIGSEAIPAIFDGLQTGVNIYFPFKAQEISSGFIQNLKNDLASSFQAEVMVIEDEYLHFQTAGELSAVDKIISDIPFTLQSAGYNQITPFKLG